MNITIKKMETDEEIRGKAYVHWKSWHEAYPGLVDPEYLQKLTLEKCEEIAYYWRTNLLVAKDGERVIGFIGAGRLRDVESADGEIFALYVLPEYYGKDIGRRLMDAALTELCDYPRVYLWVLQENPRAVKFYQKCGFRPDGEVMYNDNVKAAEIRMVLEKAKR